MVGPRQIEGIEGRNRPLAWLIVALAALLLTALLTVILITLAIRLSPNVLAPELTTGSDLKTDPGVALATAGLALFTGLLFVAAAVTAFFAYREISTSTSVNSAALALQMDNRFHSDRALRIRHGAATFLAKHQKDSTGHPKRNLQLHCYHEISPYATNQELWCGLNSDLIDLFNYYDWMGYLADEKTKAVEEEVVAQKFGPWIIMYYQLCKDEIAVVREKYPTRWRYLTPLYNRLIQREKGWYEKLGEAYPGDRNPEQINVFLQREHVRSHRGFDPGSDVNMLEGNAHPSRRLKR
jgi:hypothetical protein